MEVFAVERQLRALIKISQILHTIKDQRLVLLSCGPLSREQTFAQCIRF